MRNLRPRRLLAAAGLSAALLVAPWSNAPVGASSSSAATVERTSASTAGIRTYRGMSPSQERVLADINRSRQNRGRRYLSPNATINQRAQMFAQQLRRCQCLKHRRAPYGAPRGWYAVAENVGRSGNGGTLGRVHNAFLRSAGHRRNVLNPRWTTVGVGVARDRQGEWFVVHVFADYSR